MKIDLYNMLETVDIASEQMNSLKTICAFGRQCHIKDPIILPLITQKSSDAIKNILYTWSIAGELLSDQKLVLVHDDKIICDFIDIHLKYNEICNVLQDSVSDNKSCHSLKVYLTYSANESTSGPYENLCKWWVF